MLLAALALLTAPQEIVIPTEYVNGRVYVPVRLNGRPSAFVLDTGAGMSCLDSDFAKSVGAKFTKPISADGNGGKVQASFIENASCQVGSETQPIQIAVPLEPLSYLEGRRFEGILGTDLIGRFVVAIDYERNRVVLNPKDRFDGESIPCDFDSARPVITVQAKLAGRTYTVRTLVDTGATNAFDLTGAFVQKHPELVDLPGGKPMLASGGVGGMSLGRYVRADEIQIGKQTLLRPVTLLSLAKKGLSGKQASYDAVIGGETLRRFTLVADYAHKQLIFAPNSSIDTPFVADCSGLAVASSPRNLRRYVVRYIEPDSPASRAGMRVGDEITSVDGHSASSLTLHQLRELLKQPGKTIPLSTNRATVSLALRELY